MGSVGETILLGGRVALSLAVVLALMWFIARRLGGRAEPGRRVPITVLGRHSLGRRAGLTVVEVAGQVLLLGVSDSGITMLSQVAGPLPAADADDGASTHDAAGGEPAPVPAGRDFDALLAARTANAWQPGAAAPNMPARRTPAVAATPAARVGTGALLDPATWARAWAWRHGTPQAASR